MTIEHIIRTHVTRLNLPLGPADMTSIVPIVRNLVVQHVRGDRPADARLPGPIATRLFGACPEFATWPREEQDVVVPGPAVWSRMSLDALTTPVADEMVIAGDLPFNGHPERGVVEVLRVVKEAMKPRRAVGASWDGVAVLEASIEGYLASRRRPAPQPTRGEIIAQEYGFDVFDAA